MRQYDGRSLAAGHAAGTPLVLEDPLSFWGGVDATTGTIIDVHHPQVGAQLAGTILVLPSGRGSSSSSSVLAEVIRHRVAPAAIILGAPDPIMAIGAVVAAELYGVTTPVVSVDRDAYEACATARHIEVEANAEGATIRTEGLLSTL
jgi:predicted aconitase with swiveling domain